MLVINDLSINLEKFSLKDVNLSLQKGEYFVIIGRSGTGKTVFLETLAGRYKISSGSIKKNDEEISKRAPENRDIGFVYQNYELFTHMKVSENIAFPLKFQKLSKHETNNKTKDMMDILGVTHLRDRYPQELSGGEKQRVAIGRSIIKSPKLLLLDEPFSALDCVTKEGVKDILKDIHNEFKPTVIHVTHDLKEAIYFADRIGIIKDNTINKIFDQEQLKKLSKEDTLYEYI